jgi:poly(3-hydroxybutyrate) depolymerase
MVETPDALEKWMRTVSCGRASLLPVLAFLLVACGAESAPGDFSPATEPSSDAVSAVEDEVDDVGASLGGVFAEDGVTVEDAAMNDAMTQLTDIATGDDAPSAEGVTAPDTVDPVDDSAEDVVTGQDGTAVEDAGPAAPPIMFGGVRPAPYYLPENWSEEGSMPLVVLLHGYGMTGNGMMSGWNIQQEAAARGALLIVPEGMVDPSGNHYWQGSEYCCDYYESEVDDVAYLSGLIEEASSHYPVDTARVYVVGYSNGAFMAHRMACDRSDLITGIVAFAGSTWYDAEKCGDPGPVSVLHAHGTWDITILYDEVVPHLGEPDAPATHINECLWAQCPTEYGACWADPSCATLTTCYGQCLTADDPESCNGICWGAASPYAQYLWMETFVCGLTDLCYADMTKDWWGHASAPDGVARWAEINGCEATATEGDPLDLAWDLIGEETYPMRHDGCPEGVSADLWTIQYGSHYPSFYPAWDTALFDWLLAQHKASP